MKGYEFCPEELKADQNNIFYTASLSLVPFPTKSLWGNLNSREDIQFPEENAKRDVSAAQRLFAMLQGSPVCIYKECTRWYWYSIGALCNSNTELCVCLE